MSRATQENIQRLLDLTGVTHERLSEIAGLSRSAVTQWVIGKSDPRMGPLQRIADYYGITTENLVERDGMRYVHMCSDGRLREDVTAKLSDLRAKIDRMDEETFDPKVVIAYEDAIGSLSASRRLSADEDDMVSMYRSLNDEGRRLALTTIAAYVRSGMYDDVKR